MDRSLSYAESVAHRTLSPAALIQGQRPTNLPTPPSPANAIPSSHIWTPIAVDPITVRQQVLAWLSTGTTENIMTKPFTTEQDMSKFRTSQACSRLSEFMTRASALMGACALEGGPKPVTCRQQLAKRNEFEIVNGLMKWIQQLTDLISIHRPRSASTSRYGHIQFRDWHLQFNETLEKDIQLILPSTRRNHSALLNELCTYANDAFGNATRLDYGTGHELAFLAFLCCLEMVHECENPNIAQSNELVLDFMLIVWPRYLQLIRQLIQTFRLEPAGSHGVWCVDDHFLFSYYFGSAQLVGHAHLKPKSILQPDIVDAYASDYIYLSCIQFIHEIKKGPFAEHSPMLYDMTSVPVWTKIHGGLWKMIRNELWQQWPVMQHFYCGALLPS